MNERMETFDTIENYFHVYKLDPEAKLRCVQCKMPIKAIFCLDLVCFFYSWDFGDVLV